MQVLQNMDMDTFVIVVPAVLIGLYAIISLQKYLSERNSKYAGLVVPGVIFIAATVLAFRPLFVLAGEPGVIWFCFRMWLVFNIPTIVLMFPYYRQRKQMKAMEAAMAQQAEQKAAAEEAVKETTEETVEETAEDVK